VATSFPLTIYEVQQNNQQWAIGGVAMSMAFFMEFGSALKLPPGIKPDRCCIMMTMTCDTPGFDERFYKGKQKK
jgi:hypothetical protein